MSQKKRKRERIPALSGSIETPPTISFQLELKLQHYITPKTSLWLIIPWELGMDAGLRATDAATGCKFTHLGSSVWGQAKGHPWTAFQTPSLSEGQGTLGPPPLGAISPLSHSWLQLLLVAGGDGSGWCWQGREDVIYISEQNCVFDKACNPQACKSIKAGHPDREPRSGFLA